MPVELTLALPWIFGIVGGLAIVVGAIMIWKIDERFFSRDNYCCRCRAEWHGIEKLCHECGAPGQKYRAPEKKLPAFDWQGYLDTGPIPVIVEGVDFLDRSSIVRAGLREADLSPFAPINWSSTEEETT